MQCPLCHLENPPTADRCDCGYSFKDENEEIRVIANAVYKKVTRRKAFMWILFMGMPIALTIAKVALQEISSAFKKNSTQLPR